jgi:hypothetical protein
MTIVAALHTCASCAATIRSTAAMVGPQSTQSIHKPQETADLQVLPQLCFGLPVAAA